MYALIAVAGAVAAYLAIFSLFARHDDEGTLLVTLQAFADGEALYRDIYSPYGPFYYQLFGGFFALTGLDVSTNASRLIVVVLWVFTAGLFGLAVQHLTDRLVLGLIAMTVSFGVLGVLINEPMHPHGLGVALLGAFVLLSVKEPARRHVLAGGAVGAVLAALTLTKVNLGAYAVAALALAAVLTIEPLHRRPWVRWPVIVAFLAMPVVIMARDMTLMWVQSLIALELLAMGAIIAAARLLRPGRGEDHGDLIDWLIAAVCGFIAAAGAILIAILLTGPSPGDVYDGMIREALHVRDALILPFETPPAAVNWGIAALALALLVSWLRPGVGSLSPWGGLLRIGAGLTIWFTITQSAPLALNPPPGNASVLALVLAWVAVVPPAGVLERPYKRFLRVLLPSLAVAQTLQVYPVSGSQSLIAALTFVPVGALCIGDGLASLRTWSAARGSYSLQRFGVIALVGLVALGAKFAIDEIARPIAAGAVVYRDQQPLSFPGAGLLRLPAEQADEYEQLVDLLRSNRCSTFIGYPNVNSLYLWSGIHPPRPSAPGAWVTALGDAGQQRVVDQLRVAPRPCAIRSEFRAGAWLNGRERPDAPLVNYIFDAFDSVEQIGEFEFALPRADANTVR